MSPDLKGGPEIQPAPVERVAPTHSMVYLVETGALIEIGLAGTDWGSGVHAHPSRPERNVSAELQAERDKFDVQEAAISVDGADTYKALSKGGGGDGLALNAAGVREQLAATMPEFVKRSTAEAAPAEFEALIAAASAEVLASRRVGG